MRARSHWLRWIGVLAVVIMVTAAGIKISGLVSAHAPEPPSGFDPYLYRPNSAPADPVNLIFRGATTDTVAAAVQRVLGWRPVPGSPMLFLIHDQSRPTRWQFGVDLGAGSRLHLRVASMAPDDEQVYVLAAVHRDDTVGCGHVGHAFDDERDLVARTFEAAGYSVQYVNLGNTQSAPQCDGTVSGGDGNAVIIDLGDQ